MPASFLILQFFVIFLQILPFFRPLRLTVRTPPFHGGNTDSNSVGVTSLPSHSSHGLPMSLIQKTKNWIAPPHLKKQVARFLIVGGTSTIFSYSIFLICLHSFGFHYLLANATAFIFGVAYAYPLNKIWTFDSHASRHFHLYLMVYLCSLGISSITLRTLVDFIGIIPEIANLVAIAITTCTNFLGIKFWVFKK